MNKNVAAKTFAKQLGWQETLTHLFILKPVSVAMDDTGSNDSDGAEFMNRGDHSVNAADDKVREVMESDKREEEGDNLKEGSSDTLEGAIGNTDTNCVQNGGDALGNTDLLIDCDSSCESNEQIRTLTRNSSLSQGKAVPPTSLKFRPSSDSKRKVSVDFYTQMDSPTSTPLYLKPSLFGYDDDGASFCERHDRSPSTSVEDLSEIGVRVSKMSDNSSSTSFSQFSHLSVSNSFSDLEMPSPSQVSSHEMSREQMLDSLGLRGSFLMDVMEDTEELSRNLLLILFTVMWKGVEGSDQNVWKVSEIK